MKMGGYRDMSVFDRGISVAVCEKTLRQFIHKATLDKVDKGSNACKDRQKALSILVELAVYGVKYVNENDIKLKGGKEVKE